MSASKEPRSSSFVECAICMEIYDDPRILPCGHTFCLKCVQSKQAVASSKSTENTHQCSICRQICAIPAGGLEALPKNFVVNDLKGFIAQKSGSLSFTNHCALVDDGDDHGLVEYFCVDCWYPLCNLCFRFHTKSRQTMGHVVKRLADVNDTDYAKHRTQLSLTCTKHTKKDLEFYCNGCAELLCSTCCLTSHKTHDYVELNEADETFKQKITNKVGKMRDVEKITQSQLNKGEEALKSLKTHEESITADINTFADKLLQTALDKISTDLNASKTKILHELTEIMLWEKTKLDQFVELRKQSLALTQADLSTLEGLVPSSSNVAERAEAMRLKMFKDSDEELIVGDDGFETGFDMTDAVIAWKSDADRWLESIMFMPAVGEVRDSAGHCLVESTVASAEVDEVASAEVDEVASADVDEVRDSAKVRSDSHWYESPVNFPEFDEERAMTQVKSDGYCLVEPTLASAEVDEVRDSGKVRSDGHWYESPIDFLNFGEERARTKVRSASWRRFLGEKYVSEN